MIRKKKKKRLRFWIFCAAEQLFLRNPPLSLQINERRLLSTWDPSLGVRCFHSWLPLCVLAAMHHSSLQATWQTSSDVSRAGMFVLHHTSCPIHSAPSRSGAPLLTDTLSSLAACPSSSQSQASAAHAQRTYLLMCVHTDMTKGAERVNNIHGFTLLMLHVFTKI